MIVNEDETILYDRIRYDPETNVKFWGLSISGGLVTWVDGGIQALAQATIVKSAVVSLGLCFSILFN